MDHNYDFAFNSYNSMFFGGVCQSDVLEVVQRFKSNKSTDDNTIDMSLMKEVIDCGLKTFTYICNKSFQTDIFPDKVNMTKVVPIYKNGDKHIISNYRPVSLLPQFSKILEKLFVNRLDNFMEISDLLSVTTLEGHKCFYLSVFNIPLLPVSVCERLVAGVFEWL